MERELQTIELRRLVARFQAGEAEAVNELFLRVSGRLERLAHSMLRRYPRVGQCEQTCDVVQEANISLLTALRQLTFSSTREFYGLATEHMRRRLVDLARRHGHRDRGHQPLGEALGDSELVAPPEPEAEEMERWEAFHQGVEALPAQQREVFCLRFYHGWGNEEIAELLEVSTRTVTRQWLRAQVRLGEMLGGPLSEGEG